MSRRNSRTECFPFHGWNMVESRCAGNCAGGMAGAPCAFCPEGKSLSDGKCEDCGASVVAWVAAILIGLGACGLAYFFVNMTVAWRHNLTASSGAKFHSQSQTPDRKQLRCA